MPQEIRLQDSQARIHCGLLAFQFHLRTTFDQRSIQGACKRDRDSASSTSLRSKKSDYKRIAPSPDEVNAFEDCTFDARHMDSQPCLCSSNRIQTARIRPRLNSSCGKVWTRNGHMISGTVARNVYSSVPAIICLLDYDCQHKQAIILQSKNLRNQNLNFHITFLFTYI